MSTRSGADRSPSSFPPGMGLRFTLAYGALFLPFSVATPYLQRLLRGRGFDKEEIGIVLGCLEAMAVLAPPVWGYFADRFQRPRALIGLGILGAVPSFMLFGLVRGMAASLGVAVLFGLFYRPLVPLTDGLTFRYIARHGGDYGRIRIGASVGFIAAIVVLEALGIADAESGRMILTAMAVAGSVQLLSVLALPGDRSVKRPSPAEHAAARVSWRLLLGQRAFLAFTACAFLGRVAMMSYYGFFTLYLKEVHGFSQAGYLWLLGPLSEIPVIYFSRRIMARIGVRNLFGLGLLGCTVRLLGFAASNTLSALIPLQLLHSLTFGAFHSASVTYVSRLAPAHMQSTAQTFFAAVTVGAGGIVGGALGGHVAERYGFTVLYLAFGCIAGAALLLLLTSVPEPGRRCEAGP